MLQISSEGLIRREKYDSRAITNLDIESRKNMVIRTSLDLDAALLQNRQAAI